MTLLPSKINIIQITGTINNDADNDIEENSQVQEETDPYYSEITSTTVDNHQATKFRMNTNACYNVVQLSTVGGSEAATTDYEDVQFPEYITIII